MQLGARNLDPSAPVKFALGLILMGVGFYVMVLASKYVVAGEKVLPTWLVLTYLFHTFGELCLSPVGLSSFSKLAPARFVGQALGVWFLATALGNNIAGQIAGDFDWETRADARPVHVHLLVGRDRRRRVAAADTWLSKSSREYADEIANFVALRGAGRGHRHLPCSPPAADPKAPRRRRSSKRSPSSTQVNRDLVDAQPGSKRGRLDAVHRTSPSIRSS